MFQGRYKAIVVDPEAVGAVGHYIHLNPVRARIVTPETLGQWRWTSLPGLLNARERPGWFSPAAVLEHAGGLTDTPAGRQKYLEYLAWLQADDLAQKQLQFDRLSKGWVVGTREFKKDLLREHKNLEASLERGNTEAQETAAELWEERVGTYLRALEKREADVDKDAKGAVWKIAVAEAMKSTTTASNPWLAQRLNMGSPFRLSRLVSACRTDASLCRSEMKVIAKCKS